MKFSRYFFNRQTASQNGQKFANALKVPPTSLNERNTDRPWTFSSPSSSNDKATIMKSKMFQPSWK